MQPVHVQCIPVRELAIFRMSVGIAIKASATAHTTTSMKQSVLKSEPAASAQLSASQPNF